MAAKTQTKKAQEEKPKESQGLSGMGKQEAATQEAATQNTTQNQATQNQKVSEQKPAAGSEEEQADLEPIPMNDFEKALAQGIPELVIPDEYTPTFGNPVNPRTVENLPAMFRTAWPSLPKYDNGWSLQDCRNKGYRPIQPDEVSTVDASGKLKLNAYEVVDGFVTVAGSILCIGHREQIAKRKELERGYPEDQLKVREEMLRESGIDIEDSYQRVEDYSPLAFRD